MGVTPGDVTAWQAWRARFSLVTPCAPAPHRQLERIWAETFGHSYPTGKRDRVEAHRTPAAGAGEVRMGSTAGRRVGPETPSAIVARDAVREIPVHQPLQHPVNGYSVDGRSGSQSRLDFMMSKRAIGGQQGGQHGAARPRQSLRAGADQGLGGGEFRVDAQAMGFHDAILAPPCNAVARR